MTHKMIAFEFVISINTVARAPGRAFYCATRVDFGPIREHLKAGRSTSSRP